MFKHSFLLGNILLALAMLLLLVMGKAWELMGPAAMGLWIALAGAGISLLMRDPKG